MRKTFFALALATTALAGCSKEPLLVDVGGGDRMARITVTDNVSNEGVRNLSVRLTGGTQHFEATTDYFGVAEFANIGREHNNFMVWVEDDCYATSSNYTLEAATDLAMAIGTIQVSRRGNLRLTNGTSEVYGIWINGGFEGYLGPGVSMEKYNVPTQLNFLAREETFFFPDQISYTINVTHCRNSWMTSHTFY